MDPEIHRMLLKRAGALLARRAYSRFELQKKLSAVAGEHPVESVLDHLEQLKLLNDADYAYNFAYRRIRQQGWSPEKVRSALLQHHIEQTSIEIALQQVRNESDDASTILEYAKRHCGKRGFPTDLKGIRKLILHLRHRGFDEETIFGALKGIIPVDFLQRLEPGD
jgi:SOS response regulatory protein OraA/RecX